MKIMIQPKKKNNPINDDSTSFTKESKFYDISISRNVNLQFIQKTKKSHFSRILYYNHLYMSQIYRNFVVSKGEEEKDVIKEKFCYP